MPDSLQFRLRADIRYGAESRDHVLVALETDDGVITKVVSARDFDLASQPSKIGQSELRRLTNLFAPFLVPSHQLAAVKLSPAHWRLASAKPTDRVHVHPSTSFVCVGAGTCCNAGYAIAVDRRAERNLKRAARRLRIVKPVLDGYLNNQGGCVFLDSDARCRIHERAAQPGVCRVFPAHYVRYGRRVYTTVTHRCVCGAGDEVPAFERSDAEARYAHVPRVPTLPGTTRLDGATRCPTRSVIVECQSAEGHAWDLLEDLARRWLVWGTFEGRARPSVAPDVMLYRLADWARPLDLDVHDALIGAPAVRAAKIGADYDRVGLEGSREVAMARFVRDQIVGLRTFGFSHLSAGLLAMVVALYRVSQATTHRDVVTKIIQFEDLWSTDVWRALFGPHGPVWSQARDLRTVRRMIARFRSAAGA